MAEIQSLSFVAGGRKYGVSGNAVRKWVRWYRYERERSRSGEVARPGEDATGADDE